MSEIPDFRHPPTPSPTPEGRVDKCRGGRYGRYMADITTTQDPKERLVMTEPIESAGDGIKRLQAELALAEERYAAMQAEWAKTIEDRDAYANTLFAIERTVRKQREALEQLEHWDMLTIAHDHRGWYGVSTGDAVWARRLIAKALGDPDPTAALAPDTEEGT